MARDKQARAARRAAERAELERRRLEARERPASPTLEDTETREADIQHAARHMRVTDLLALVAAFSASR